LGGELTIFPENLIPHPLDLIIFHDQDFGGVCLYDQIAQLLPDFSRLGGLSQISVDHPRLKKAAEDFS